MGFSLFKRAFKKSSEEKDYEEFLKAYTNCLPLKEDPSSQYSLKQLKKKSVQVIVLQDVKCLSKPAFIFDSFNPTKDFSKCTPSQCRFVTNGKNLNLQDIVFGNIPLSRNSGIRSSMKIHFLQDTEQILISKIVHGFRKNCHTPTSTEFDSSTLAAAVALALGTNSDSYHPPAAHSDHVSIPGSKNRTGSTREHQRNHSLSHSPSSLSDLQFWSTSPPADAPLTPSQQSRISRNYRHSLHSKTRSLPSQNQMSSRVDVLPTEPRSLPGGSCLSMAGVRGSYDTGGGGSDSRGINLAICIILTPPSSTDPDENNSSTPFGSLQSFNTGCSEGGVVGTIVGGVVAPIASSETSRAGATSQKQTPAPRWSTRFHSFLFKHFAQVEVLVQGLEDHVTSTISSGPWSSERSARFLRARDDFFQGLNDLLITPRLHLPVWLSLTVCDRDQSRMPQRKLRHYFVRQCLVKLISRLNLPSSKLFPSRLITGVLIYHLGWIPSVVPAGGKLAKRCLMKHRPRWANAMAQTNPYNPLWAQLNDLFGGGGTRMSRTVIVGRHKAQVSSLLYLVSYFLRCANVTQTEERLPDLSRADLFELQQRKLNKPSHDSGISSQEDLAHVYPASCGSSPTPCTHLALVDTGRLTRGQCRQAEAAAKALVVSTGGPPTNQFDCAINRQSSSKQRPTSPPADSNLRSSPWVSPKTTTSFMGPSESGRQLIEIPLLYNNLITDDDESPSFSEPLPVSRTSTPHVPVASSAPSHRKSSHSHSTRLPFPDDISSSSFTGSSNSVNNLRQASWSPQEMSLGHSMLGGCSDRYVNGFALQGTTQTEAAFKEHLIADLRLCLRQSSHDEPLSECSALVANVDEKTVQIITVAQGCSKVEESEVTASHLVVSMLDTVASLSQRQTCPELCLQHLEARLQEIYFRSLSLADLLDSSHQCSSDPIAHMSSGKLAAAIGVEENDIPLLLAAASTRSPVFYGSS